MMELTHLVNQLEKNISQATASSPSVSKRGVDWHIDHCLKIINITSESLITSDVNKYRKKFNLYKVVFLSLGYFPRGKVRAPGIVNNKGVIAIDDLTLQLDKARNLLQQLGDLPDNSNFKHPFFGLLNLKESERFMAVHTFHHLKIINKILSKN